jgi:hypothetical protein
MESCKTIGGNMERHHVEYTAGARACACWYLRTHLQRLPPVHVRMRVHVSHTVFKSIGTEGECK